MKVNKYLVIAIIILVINLVFVCFKLYKVTHSETDYVQELAKKEIANNTSVLFYNNIISKNELSIDSLTKELVIIKANKKSITVKYRTLYDTINSTPDSLQYNITKQLCSRYRGRKLQRN